MLERTRPEAARALNDALGAAYAAAPAGLLELARARIHTLLGGPPSEPGTTLTDTEQLALEFTEQYVLDVANMPDELVDAFRDRLGTEQLYAFVMGLYAVDQAERLAMSTTVVPV